MAALLGLHFRAALCAIALIATPSAVLAIDPEERLEDPVLEEKARDIAKQLRCVVCDNATIDDSDAQVAKDMRKLVRERVVEGKSATEIKAEFVSYYGEYVLMKPSFSWANAVIWGATPLALLIGGVWVYRRTRAPGGAAPAAAAASGGAMSNDPSDPSSPPPLSADEQARLDALLKGGD